MTGNINKIVMPVVYKGMETIKPWVDIVRSNETEYDSSKQDYSPSQIADSIKVIHLTKRYGAQIKVPTFNRIGSIMGTSIHEYFEKMWLKHNKRVGFEEYRTEVRHFMQVHGKKLGGCYDCLHVPTKSLWDIKTTSTSSVMTEYLQESIDKWAVQQNIYRLLVKENEGIGLKSLNILGVFIDWKTYLLSKHYRKGYPKERIMKFELPIWGHGEVRKYLNNRIQELKEYENTPDDELPDCTPKQRWSRSVYKVYHTNNMKRALSAKHVTNKSAQEFIEEHRYNHNDSKFNPNGYSIKYSHGKQTRCKDWCPFNSICQQYKDIVKKHGDPKW